MFRRLLTQLGVLRATLLATVASIAISVAITMLLNFLMTGDVGTTGLLIAIVVPGVIAPLFGGLTLRLASQLIRAEEKLRILATTDELTRAYNRRHFFELAEKEFSRAQRYGEVFAVIIFDMDDFKSINDTQGHGAGDHVLRAVSQICMQQIRRADTFARYGGEEFVFLLPRTSHAAAREFAERIRALVASTPIRYGTQDIQVTISMGVKAFDGRAQNFDAVLMGADRALYDAKANGKNHIVAI